MKKKLIEVLTEANEEFMSYFPEHVKGISRDYWREYLKDTPYAEREFLKIWGSFELLKDEIKDKLDREHLNIIKDKRKTSKGKKYFVSAIVQGEPINEAFIESIKNYCKHANAELVLLTMRGVVLTSFYGESVFEEYGEYFATEFRFNDSLVARDFILNPQMIRPTTGLGRFGQKEFSLITASPKQFLQTIPTKKDDLPHIVYTTGTICNPQYRQTRVGAFAEQDNLLGGLIVEVIDKDRFNIRNVVADNKFGFYDLNTYYCRKEKPKKVTAEAVVCGDFHWGQEDENAVKATKDLVKRMKPKKVYWHDMFDGKSVNPHIENHMLARLGRDTHQKSLKKELQYLADKILDWQKSLPPHKIMVVPSNHDDFIDRYITQRKFVYDEENIVLACKLFVALAEGYNAIEWWLKKEAKINTKNIQFLKMDESSEVGEVELNVHGHIGSNGVKGSPVSLETAYGSCVTGHCFSDDTEILTKNKGWINGLALELTDEVMTMNKITRKAEWNDIENISVYDNYKELYHIKSKACDLMVTGKHGLIAEHTNGTLREFTALEMTTIKNKFKFLNALSTDNTLNIDKRILQLYVQIITDGSYSDGSIRWHLKKDRKIKRLVKILDGLNINYSISKTKIKTTRIRIPVKDAKNLIEELPQKMIPKWFLHLSEECIDIVLDEYGITDGTIYSNRNMQLSTSKKHDADILQTMAFLRGYRCSIFERKYKKCNTNYALNITKTNFITMNKTHIKKVAYSGKVWCPTVKNGTVAVRRKGKVVVTQNTHAPGIFREVYTVGCNCKLRQDYNKGGSSWLHGNCIVYKGGVRQMIIIVDGAY